MIEASMLTQETYYLQKQERKTKQNFPLKNSLDNDGADKEKRKYAMEKMFSGKQSEMEDATLSFSFTRVK